MRLLALTGSTGAPNTCYIGAYDAMIKTKFFISSLARGAYIIIHPTFMFDDEIRAGRGRSGVFSACNIAHIVLYCYKAL